MAHIKPIRTFGDAVLRQRVPESDPAQDWVEVRKSLRDTVIAARGLGLAANQILLEHTPRIAIVDGTIYTNPKIVEVSTETEKMAEGCLSLPTLQGVVARPIWVVVSAIVRGEEITQRFVGKDARAMLHEIDHLEGKLYIDHMPPMGRSMLVKRWRRHFRVGQPYLPPER